MAKIVQTLTRASAEYEEDIDQKKKEKQLKKALMKDLKILEVLVVYNG